MGVGGGNKFPPPAIFLYPGLGRERGTIHTKSKQREELVVVVNRAVKQSFSLCSSTLEW